MSKGRRVTPYRMKEIEIEPRIPLASGDPNDPCEGLLLPVHQTIPNLQRFRPHDLPSEAEKLLTIRWGREMGNRVQIDGAEISEIHWYGVDARATFNFT